MADSIDIAGLKNLIKGPFAPIILDVRRKADIEASPYKIHGAIWRDPDRINDWSTELSVGRKIIAYCVKGGAVSQSVAERLDREGHDIAFLEGGLKAWADAGEPVE